MIADKMMSKRERNAVYALAFLTLAVIARLTILIRRRSKDDFAAVDAFAALQILLVSVTFLVVIGAPYVKVLWRRLRGTSITGYFGYLGFCCVGVLWSALPKFSAYRVGEHITETVAVVLIIYYFHEYYRAEKAGLVLGWMVLLLGVGANLRLHGFSVGGLRSNNYGATAAMICAYSFGEMWGATGKRSKWLKLSCGGALVWVVLSQSLASWLSVLLGFLIAGIVRKKGKGGFLLLSLIVLIPLASSPDLRQKYLFKNRSDEELKSMTGRRTLWDTYYDEFKKKPILGHGFGVIARVADIPMTNTHNSAYAILLGGGIIGAIFVVVGAFKYWKEVLRGVRAHNGPGLSGCTAALCAGALNSMSIGFLGETWMPPTYVFMLFLALHTFFIAKPAKPINHADTIDSSRSRAAKKKTRSRRHHAPQPVPATTDADPA